MTTKWKIIAGFIVMIALLCTIAVIGYLSLSKATEGLDTYRRVAGVNVRTSDMLANQFAAASAFRLFRIEMKPELMEEARAAIRSNTPLIQESRERSRLQVTLDDLDLVEKYAAEQLSLFNEVEKSLLAMMDQFLNGAQPAARGIGEALVAMNDAAANVDNDPALHANAKALNDLAWLRSALSRFAYQPTHANAERAQEMLRNLAASVDALNVTLYTETGRAGFAAVRQSYDELAAALNTMQTLAAQEEEYTTHLMQLNADARAAVTRVSTLSDSTMEEAGANTVQVNQIAQKSMLFVSALGLLIGAVLAVVIIFGLIRVLRGMNEFAEAIAKGDFQAKVNSREKGEIGRVLDAMRQIPTVLEKLIAELEADANKISIGDYNVRIPDKSFPGSFDTLAASVNTVCDAYTKILDSMPLAIFTATADKRTLYANALVHTILGGEMAGKECSSCFNTPNCNNAECFGTKAIQSKSVINGEIDIHPASGANLEISVSAIPLLDHTGTAKAFMEICADITETKKQQRMIRSVTEKAAGISNRVAAASEELSAQVEQVTRGADMQRSRVESTASAMTEMNSTVLEVARSAGEASEQSEMTRSKASEGAALVENVVHSINMVNKVANNLQNNMRELGEQAESIGGVMNVISDIADQTNLLALNAAIEAARAGEAGRGFAVVADEVRKLAEKTMTATQEVGNNITSIQNSARTNISEVNEAARAVTEATELANTSGQALAEIVNMAARNSAVVTSIATAAEEQSATSEEINQSIEDINRIVGETAEGMTQSSSAVQELSRMAQELNRVMAELR